MGETRRVLRDGDWDEVRKRKRSQKAVMVHPIDGGRYI